MPRDRPPLPIDAALPPLLSALRTTSAAVLRAPTGAGKTTRVPPALVESGLAGTGLVLMLEPRRVAARAAARRVALRTGCAARRRVRLPGPVRPQSQCADARSRNHARCPAPPVARRPVPRRRRV